MSNNVLFKDNKYRGKYVAVKSMSKPKVISSGTNPKTVHDKAVKEGVEKPLLIFVPKKNIANIY